MKKIATLLICIGFLFSIAAQAQKKQKEKKPQLTKPAIGVLTLGNAGHGKSTLTAAITKVLSQTGRAKLVTYDEIANTSETNVKGVKLNAAQVEYESDKARYTHFDCRTDSDCVKLLSLKGVKLNGAILVVSAADGPMPQTRDNIILAQKNDIKFIVVYLNKVDLVSDPELLKLVEFETRELLTKYGFNGDIVQFVNGSALMALKGIKDDIGKNSIIKLLSAMDASFIK